MTAGSFRSGRVFLAGDSAHAMPPTGGFGGNTGVADAHNLAWKLAPVSRGVAGAGLLDTYDAERRPISTRTVEQAYTRYALRVDASLPRDDLAPPLDDPAIERGAIYRWSAVGTDDAPGGPLDDPHARTWTVGARVPHVVVSGGHGPISTLDTADDGFALVVEDGHERWQQVADDATRPLGIPVSVHLLNPGEIPRIAEPSAAQPGAGRQGAALIRPDRVLAWKPPPPADRAAEQLGDTLVRLVSKG